MPQGLENRKEYYRDHGVLAVLELCYTRNDCNLSLPNLNVAINEMIAIRSIGKETGLIK